MDLTADTTTDPARKTLLICFLHDHLREVMSVQCSIIEAALLGDDFISQSTSERLRDAASVYLSYAEQIDQKLSGPAFSAVPPN